jgi:hypothetical protein
MGSGGMAKGAKKEGQKTVNLTLNANEVLVAGYVGMRRNAEARFNRRKARFPEKVIGELWGFHIESAHAELCVAKALGLYWGFGVCTFHVEDIENSGIEVRWSGRRKDCKIRPDDKGFIVSVSGQCPDYEIKGWIKAEDGKKEEFYRADPPPAYFVPHERLKSIEELAEIIKEKR